MLNRTQFLDIAHSTVSRFIPRDLFNEIVGRILTVELPPLFDEPEQIELLQKAVLLCANSLTTVHATRFICHRLNPEQYCPEGDDQWMEAHNGLIEVDYALREEVWRTMENRVSDVFSYYRTMTGNAESPVETTNLFGFAQGCYTVLATIEQLNVVDPFQKHSANWERSLNGTAKLLVDRDTVAQAVGAWSDLVALQYNHHTLIGDHSVNKQVGKQHAVGNFYQHAGAYLHRIAFVAAQTAV